MPQLVSQFVSQLPLSNLNIIHFIKTDLIVSGRYKLCFVLNDITKQFAFKMMTIVFYGSFHLLQDFIVHVKPTILHAFN